MNLATTDAQYPFNAEKPPSGWAVVPVGEAVLEIQPGYSSGAHNKEGKGVIHLRPMNIDRQGRLDLSVIKYVPESVNETLRTQRGDVIFNNTNSAELIGKTTSIDSDVEFAFSNHMTRLRPPKGLSAKFIAYQLHFLWMSGYFRAICTHHVNQASISSGTLAQAVPLLVAPTAEQKRIVDEIEKQFSRLDVAVGMLQRVGRNLEHLRTATLTAAVEGRLVPTEADIAQTEGRDYEAADVLLKRILHERRVEWEADQLTKMKEQGKTPKDDKWKEKYPEPSVPGSNRLDEMPEGWVITSLEQITSAVRAIRYGILMPKENVSDGILYVKVKDFKGDKIDLTSLHRTSPEIAAVYSRASLKAGDILLAIRGTYGRVAEVPPELEGGNITQDTARLAVSKPINHRYVALFLRSANTQKYFNSVARGVAVKGVNIADVRLTPIFLPPLAEQNRIVDEVERRVSVIEELKVIITKALRRATILRQKILRDAFAGKLVPQDAEGEPASILLERIRVEKAEREAESVQARKERRGKMKGRKAKVSGRKPRRPLSEVVAETKRRLTPEQLFVEAGFTPEVVEDFYEELRREIKAGHIEQVRPDNATVYLTTANS